MKILSLGLGSGTTEKSETSMSSPHVAGVAALIAAANPGATPAQIRLIEGGECANGATHSGNGCNKEWRGDPDAFPEPLVNAPGALAVVIGTPTAPDAPSALGATAVSDSQIDLDWTDASNNEDGFKIETSADGGTTFTEIATVGANETAYSDTGLPASTTRHYRVRAFNAVDNSDYSNTASATTEATPDPGSAPTVSSCSPDNGNQNERLLVQVTGLNFENSATVDFGDRVNVQSVTFVSPTRLDVQIKVHKRAASGPRNVTVTNPDSQQGTGLACFTAN